MTESLPPPDNLHNNPENEFKTYGSLEDAFADVLGFRLPENVQDFPINFLLPNYLSQGIKDAFLDDPHYGSPVPKSRSQIVGMLGKDGKLHDSKVFIGTPHRTSDYLHELPRFLKGPLALEHWYTRENPPYPHKSDIADTRRVHRAIIHTIATPEAVSSIILSKSAIPRGIIRSTRDVFRTFDDLHHRQIEQPKGVEDFIELARYLENRGAALYMWVPQGQNHDLRKLLKHPSRLPEFNDGIPLRRVASSLVHGKSGG